MRRVYLALLVAVLAVPSALAQQMPCRPNYRPGEYAPPGCQVHPPPGMPVYQSWGSGFGTSTSTLPRAPAPRHDWRYFGGYNALYGFGR